MYVFSPQPKEIEIPENSVLSEMTAGDLVTQFLSMGRESHRLGGPHVGLWFQSEFETNPAPPDASISTPAGYGDLKFCQTASLGFEVMEDPNDIGSVLKYRMFLSRFYRDFVYPRDPKISTVVTRVYFSIRHTGCNPHVSVKKDVPGFII